MTAQEKKNTRKGCWIALAIVLIAPIVSVLLIAQFAPLVIVPGIRVLIDTVTYSEPDNMDEIRQNLTIVEDLSYGEAQHSMMDIYYPADAATPLPVVMYIHGGGFIAGDKSALQTFAMSIANEGYVVANINYGLAPEQPYPAAITQINEALTFLSEEIDTYGGDIYQLFIAGNSAGAHLSSQIAAVITNEDFATQMDLQPAITADQLQGVVLINGIYNMQTLRETGFPNIGLYMRAYTGAEEFENYVRIDEISTVQHVTSAYPPVFITVGDIDPLQSQTLEMIETLQNNQIDLTSVLFTDTGANLDHDFILNLDQDYSQQAFRQLIDFLNEHSAG